MGPIGAVLILLVIFGSITGIILGLMQLRNRNQERMAIIEKGADPALFEHEFKSNGNLALKAGIFLIGIALGIIMGNLLYYYTNAFQNENVAYFSSIFLFGGLSLLLGAYIDKKKKA
ncbi:MAG: DUF6249 domain-containing protein [Bacteroidales bacterium]